MPPAPGRFSTTTDWPQRFDRSSPSVRATMSTAPPGANGTKMCTGRDGKASCAAAISNEARSEMIAAKSLIHPVIACLLVVVGACTHLEGPIAFRDALPLIPSPRRGEGMRLGIVAIISIGYWRCERQRKGQTAHHK